MPHTATMTLRLPIETRSRLERLAQSTDRSKAYLAGKAIEDFLNAQEWQVKAIHDAVHEADQPGAAFHDHTEVAARLRRLSKTPARRKAK